jgi:hypothetical protein
MCVAWCWTTSPHPVYVQVRVGVWSVKCNGGLCMDVVVVLCGTLCTSALTHDHDVQRCMCVCVCVCVRVCVSFGGGGGVWCVWCVCLMGGGGRWVAGCCALCQETCKVPPLQRAALHCSVLHPPPPISHLCLLSSACSTARGCVRMCVSPCPYPPSHHPLRAPQ